MQDTPNIIRGIQGPDYKALFFSEPMAALKIPITLKAGYGIVEQGTLLAEVEVADVGTGYYIPYNPLTFTGDVLQCARAFLVADNSSSAVIYVTQKDSYRFAVGDDIIINSTGNTAADLGVIKEIDRTTERQRAKITATSSSGTTFTTAHSAYITCEAGTAVGTGGTDYSTAVGVLDKDVDTGVGENAKGANATLILGNAVLYTSALVNLDDTGLTDLGGTSVSRFTKI